ncbi:triacylglycerol lipase [Nocardioides sp. SYSU D00038]|uniref:esterase/lipase family protein n=1 Tax=Nocardioides sp. SYSU D00038 TaxID=2812554 RepID=UPI001967A7CC|nr:alpha/beta fold hydrolase [Nocardioides sp. SYSU D00038]
MRRLGTVLATALALLLLALGLTATPAAAAGLGAGVPFPLPTSPLGDPPGANDWDCRPSAERPTPVVLVHGTIGDRRSLLERMSAELAGRGWCVFSLDYGNRGTGEISRSAAQLRDFVDRVLAATGAAKVSMVGHSQGGMMPRYYIKHLGGANKVDDLVGLAPSNHGTMLVNRLTALVLGIPCPACVQQAAGSPFLSALNAGDETPGDVDYTVVTTRLDEVVVPHRLGYLEPGPRVTNLTIQERCPLNVAEHLLIPLTRPAIAWTIDALSHPGPADPRVRVPC